MDSVSKDAEPDDQRGGAFKQGGDYIGHQGFGDGRGYQHSDLISYGMNNLGKQSRKIGGDSNAT